MYQAAYIDFSKGSYPLAITGFREFLRRYPDDALAGNAQYWIGEAQLGRRAQPDQQRGRRTGRTPALEQAVQEFRKVVANYPRSGKAPGRALQGGADAHRTEAARRRAGPPAVSRWRTFRRRPRRRSPENNSPP